ncbi:hypothetical protein [Butyrivibrio sp. MB2005]|uniref:hypothetical protein n=1 Tax=Butyrivibrio sp. MB2005 TaxID=1280678 RepID=UPI00047E0E9C|nr:hypothetical protein [Butyrivibrio sp. MB2005]
MKKLRLFILVIIILIALIFTGRFVYMRFFKTYKVGTDPKLYEITRATYLTGTQSTDYGYIYDQYTIRKRDKKYYAETDIFDKELKQQVVTEVEIIGAEYDATLKLLEGCEFVRHKAAGSKVMDGFMDNSSYSAELMWDKKPDGAWDLRMDSDTRKAFSEAIEKFTQKINVTIVDDVAPSSVWIIRDTPENRKTSVWGTAMVKPEELGKDYSFDIPLSDDDKYLFHMIDEDGLYYSADIPKLLDGWKVRIYTSDKEYHHVVLEICDDSGALISEIDVFSAAL